MTYLYRGADLKRLNTVEFPNGEIPANTFPVWYGDFTDEELAESRNAHGLYKYADRIIRRDDVPVTGGLSESVSAAVKFTKSTKPPGAVLFINRNRMSEDVTPIQYNAEWFDNHPGAIAHVSTLNKGEFRVGDEIYGLMSENDNGWYINRWGREGVESRATSSTYTSEQELVSFADGVSLGDSVDAIATYGGTTGVSPYKLYEYVKEIGPYRSSLGSLIPYDDGGEIIRKDDYRELAEAAHSAMLEFMQYQPDTYYIVAVTSMNDVRGGPISDDTFQFAYDGSRFIEDPDTAEARMLRGVR